MTNVQTWSVESGAPLQSFLEWPECPQVVREALTGVLSWQARNETSIGRALRAPVIAPQWVAALLAWGVTVSIAGDDVAELPIADALDQRLAGQVARVYVPVGPPEQAWERRWGEAHVARTPADERIVSVTAVVDLAEDVIQEARLTLTGVADAPVVLATAAGGLAHIRLAAADFAAIAAAVGQEVSPREDMLGSAEYRRAMAGVLTRRALDACRQVR